MQSRHKSGTGSTLHTMDVAHPPLRPAAVEQELLEIFRTAPDIQGLRVVKIIHGYGSTGPGGVTKDVVRNWLFRERRKFRRVIEGENYTLYNPATQEMRLAVGTYPDRDLAAGNPGLTVVWVR